MVSVYSYYVHFFVYTICYTVLEDESVRLKIYERMRDMKGFEKIIGYGSVKKELEQISDVLKNREVYAKLGVKPPRGLLLHGVPGVGKSLMASELIEASGLNAFVCRKDKPNGEFVNEIKSTFEKAAKNAPSIVFLDDMDKFANGDERHPDAEEYVTVQSCIDETKSKDVFVIATANNLLCLPYSLLRSGRFDRQIYVDTPTISDAEQIIAYYLSDKNVSSELDINSIAKIMLNHSCATLETVINEAGMYAGYNRAECITMNYFMKAAMHSLFNVPYSVLNNPDIFDKNDTTLMKIAYHEAGHAVIHEVLDPDSITIVSAYSNTNNTGGFTSFCNNEITDPYDRVQLEIIASLAGKAAVEQKLCCIDIGPSEDLQRAFRRVRKLVVDNCVCGFNLYGGSREYSNDLMAHQEQVIADEIEKYYRIAKGIITQNDELLEAIATALIEKKFLSGRDIRDIRSKCKIVRAGSLNRLRYKSTPIRDNT